MNKFSKRHYQAIAEVIKKQVQWNDEQGNVVSKSEDINIALELLNVFSADNPQFDRERFLQACGLKS